MSSLRVIEHAVAKALAARSVQGNESFPATMTLKVQGLGIDVTFDGDIELAR